MWQRRSVPPQARPCRTRGRSCSLASCFYTPCARSGERQWSPGRSISVAPNSCDDLLQPALQMVRPLAPRERTDRNVTSVRISERELLRSSVRIEVLLLFEPTDERACPLECQVEIIDTEEQ